MGVTMPGDFKLGGYKKFAACIGTSKLASLVCRQHSVSCTKKIIIVWCYTFTEP